MKNKIAALSLLIAVTVTVLSGILLETEQKALSGKLIRLHVVADSDSPADQTLKLQVRDRVLEEAAVLLESVSDQKMAAAILTSHTGQLARAAVTALREQGCTDPVTVTVAEEAFPTREYDTFSLPAGTYTALRVVIGSGGGQNWWCVVFPSICTEAATEDAAAVMNLSREEMDLITGNGTGYVLKFKLLELLEQLKQAVGRNG